MSTQPYVFEVTAEASGRLLIFAESTEDAYAALQERTDDLIADLEQTANLPENPYVTYSFDVRPATGAEIALNTGITLTPGRLDVYQCPHCAAEAAANEGEVA